MSYCSLHAEMHLEGIPPYDEYGIYHVVCGVGFDGGGFHCCWWWYLEL